MKEERIQRRLAAILAADVVSYSRLMGDDEVGTLSALKSHRHELIDPAVEKYSGRIVKLMGDGILVEFPSVVEAVQCAVVIQEESYKRNAEVPEPRRMVFRIGINVGDVIIDDDDIYGDGVNLAARIEALAEPGGICISHTARDQIRDKLDIVLDDLGEHEVKNIARPVRLFRVQIDSPEDPPKTLAQASKRASGSDSKIRPSIAVLPLDNMSSDPEQEFFADGLTEDLITELSRFSDLTVIARNSTFTYKGRSVKVQEVADDLGVRYVVEGSVRRAGSRMRVTVQLIDATSGEHIWAERYDRDIEDIFDLQDEITQTIASTIPGRVEEVERVRPKRPNGLAAYDYVIRGKILHHRGTREDNAEARELLDKAIELDPEYSSAYAWKACVLGQAWARGFGAKKDLFPEAAEAVRKAYALDPNECECHRLISSVRLLERNFEQAEHHQERGLALNPNYDLLVVQNGELFTWTGRAEEGVEWILKAMRLNPFHPERFWSHLGRAYFVAHRYEEAIDAFKRIARPDIGQKAFIAACQAALGRDDKAKSIAREVLEMEPVFSSHGFVDSLPYRDEPDRIHHCENLIAAGLPW